MKYNVWNLLEIAESANAPDKLPDDSPDWWHDITFEAKDKWKVVIFYDGEELDYIDHFITPEGKIINFWDWPDGRDKNLLMNWRGNGDLKRLLSMTLNERR